MSKKDRPFVPMRIAVLTISNSRSVADDTAGDLIQTQLEGAGHTVAKRTLQRCDLDGLRTLIRTWDADPNVDFIITSGGTGLTPDDVLPGAIAPLITKPIPGFGELFRWLSYADIGSSTIASRAEAALLGGTILFCLPGSPGACRLGLEKIILPQLDARTGPCNLVSLLPRIRP